MTDNTKLSFVFDAAKVIDLSHCIAENMPVYPGARPPRLTTTSAIAQHGFKETWLAMLSHTGTHVDAPAHIAANGQTLDKMPMADFCGTALLIDCLQPARPGWLGLEDIAGLAEQLKKVDFILFHTGWSQYWGRDEYFQKYPRISPELADFIAASHLKGIGLDSSSIEVIDSLDLPCHHIILQAGKLIVENLTNLDRLGNNYFAFFALPLKYHNSDGAPVRAMAILQ